MNRAAKRPLSSCTQRSVIDAVTAANPKRRMDEVVAIGVVSCGAAAWREIRHKR